MHLHVQAAEDGDEPGGHRNYICPALQTGLCDWSAKYFAQPVMKVEFPVVPFLRLSLHPSPHPASDSKMKVI